MNQLIPLIICACMFIAHLKPFRSLKPHAIRLLVHNRIVC